MFRLKLLLFLCISVGISLLGFSFADNFSQDFNTYMTKVNDALQKGNANVTALNDGSVKRLIANYCSAVTSQQSGFNQSGFVYSAQQSVFVFLLCSNVGTTAGAYTSKLDGFQK
jgi:D-serine dehydratase